MTKIIFFAPEARSVLTIDAEAGPSDYAVVYYYHVLILNNIWDRHYVPVNLYSGLINWFYEVRMEPF